MTKAKGVDCVLTHSLVVFIIKKTDAKRRVTFVARHKIRNNKIAASFPRSIVIRKTRDASLNIRTTNNVFV